MPGVLEQMELSVRRKRNVLRPGNSGSGTRPELQGGSRREGCDFATPFTVCRECGEEEVYRIGRAFG